MRRWALPPDAVHLLMRHEARDAAWPAIVEEAAAYCREHELGIIVVDTWDRWTGLRGDAENRAGDVNEALEPLAYAAASGLAVFIATHQRKSVGEYGEAVRGSNALTGGVDVVVELERPAPSVSAGKGARVLRAVSRFASTPDELVADSTTTATTRAATPSPSESRPRRQPCSRFSLPSARPRPRSSLR